MFVAVALFLAAAWPGAGERGLVAEEVLPTLARWPVVLERGPAGVVRAPPWEPDAPPRPRWVATTTWPQVGWDGPTRVWPLYIRGHQAAVGAWWSLAVAPLVGGGAAGLQRASVVLTAILVVLAWLLARRVEPGETATTPSPALAAVVVALSFGTVFIARTGYAYEIASRVGLVACLVVAAARSPLSVRRAVALGVLVAAAVISRATIAATLAPALAMLLMHPERRPGRRELAVVLGLSLTPVLFVALTDALIPFAPGTAPLAEFPWAFLRERLVRAPGHLVVQLAWLGDASSVLRPLRMGTVPGGPHLALAAVLGAVPVAVGLVRWWRGVAGDGERMLVVTVLGNTVLGAALYDSPEQFQLAIALDALLGVALAGQLASVSSPRLRMAAIVVVVGLKATTLGAALADDAHIANPMLSGKSQRAALAWLDTRGARGPDILTTTYNQVGVLETWTTGRLAPVHAWQLLKNPGSRAGDPFGVAPAEQWALAAVKDALEATRPRFVLLSEGPNAMDGPFSDCTAVAAALPDAAAALGARVVDRVGFPTEAGGPGWAVVELGW
ncbi:MAG: hypothetical protein U0228_10335 [Myxococcaceae bacterium]